MKTSRVLFIILCCLAFINCKKQAGNNKNNMKNIKENNMNERILDKSSLYLFYNENIIDSFPNKDLLITRYMQEWYANGEHYEEGYEPNEADLTFGYLFTNHSLEVQGYKKVSDDIFYDRIQSIFGITKKDINNKNLILSFNDFFVRVNNIDETKTPDLAFSQEMDYIYFSPKYCIVSDIPLSVRHTNKREDDNLDLIAHPYLYHRNKYIFNDNNASLTWLINNDIGFLETLIREFGYDKDDKINRAIMDKVNKDYVSTQPYNVELLTGLFVKKDYTGKLQIREGLIKTVVDATTIDDKELLNMLESYGYTLRSSLDKNFDLYPQIYEDFSIDQRIRIIAYIGYYTQALYNKYSMEMTSGAWIKSLLYNFYIQNPDQFKKIAESDYYNLPDFKKIIDGVIQDVQDFSTPHNGGEN